MSAADTVCVASASDIPAAPAHAMPDASRRPTALPTRTVVAMPMPSGSMNVTDAQLIAIWCAAAGTSPSRPTSSAVATNSEPSMKIDTPIGTPTRSSAPISRQRGGSKRANGRASR